MMERMKEDMSDKMSIPTESFATIPLTEVRGKRNVSIENHGGILEYTNERVKVAVRRGSICVFGTGLAIVRMTRKRVEIRGTIRGLEFE